MLFLKLFALCFFFYSDLLAELNIDITQGNVDPIPIAMLNFESTDQGVSEIAEKIKRVVENNLERSGLFKFLSQKIFIQKNIVFSQKPSFSDWRVTTAQGLIHGKATKMVGDKIRLEFRLWDVFSEKQMVAQQLITKESNWRRISHVISDIIYNRITGESGYFDSRIVYISESGRKNNRKKRLAIMDQDGANHKFLTDGSYLALTPRCRIGSHCE